MVTLKKRKGKWTVEVRRKGYRNMYKTFTLKSDAQSFIHKVESDIQQSRYKDVSEVANITFKVALHRYIHNFNFIILIYNFQSYCKRKFLFLN